MPRRHRIAFENAHYHIFNRAASRKTACFTENHFQFFLKVLDYITHEYSVCIYAYCMMNNHYHLYMSTPKGNISEVMWYFGMVFTRYINKSINADGPLFKSRFRDVLVDSDSYSLHLTRYIHLNPVSANLVTLPESYRWSSYQHYIQSNEKPSFLNTSFITDHFCNAVELDEFTKLGIDQETHSFYRKKKIQRIWGDSAFCRQFY